MKISITVTEAFWLTRSVNRTLQILKKEDADSKKVLTLESIQNSIRGVEILLPTEWNGNNFEDQSVSSFEIEIFPRQAKLIRQMAEASAKALATKIIPEYEQRQENEPDADFSHYIMSAKGRVKSLKEIAEKFGAAE